MPPFHPLKSSKRNLAISPPRSLSLNFHHIYFFSCCLSIIVLNSKALHDEYALFILGVMNKFNEMCTTQSCQKKVNPYLFNENKNSFVPLIYNGIDST